MSDDLLRDREFQDRLLAALEKPKKHWFIQIINSAAFLWLATLVLVTVGGGYLTNFQQCVKDGSLVTDRYAKLNREIYVRIEAIHQAVENASSIQQLRDQVSKLPSNYAELRERTLFELTRELSTLRKRVDTSALPQQKFTGIFYRESPFDTLYQGFVPKELTDAMLPELKKEDKYRFDAVKSRYIENALIEMAPNCTVKTTLLNAIGVQDAQIASASPNLYARTFGTTVDPTFVPQGAARAHDSSLSGAPK